MEAKEYGGMMTKRYVKWGSIRSFLLKAILVSLIISPIHAKGLSFNSIAWPFLLLVSIGCLVVLVFQTINVKGFKFNFVLFALPITFLISVMIRVPFWIFLFAALFLFIILKNELENNLHDEIVGGEGILVYTVLAALVIWAVAGIFSFSFLYSVLFLVLLQFLIFSIGTFVGRYFELGIENGKKLFFLTFTAGTMGILLGAFFISYLFSHYLRQFLDVILSIFAKLLIFISEPVIVLFTKSLLNKETEETSIISPGDVYGNLDSEDVLNLEPTNASNHLAIVFVLIIIVVVGMYAFKKFRTKRPQPVDHNTTSNTFYTKVTPLQKRETVSPQYSFIENEIRNEIKSLERFAAKKKLERFPYESFREWFNRIGVKISKESKNIYEGVRYGNINATNDEIKNFIAEINNVKEEIEQIGKKWNE
ncbi:hypothetical protein [Lederbergia panacisoli]|uniref:hypothetical protein n=1 Tax=Lederbergia panacisoli TaxID=1255251 RepID=UPI00214ADB7D|nr:hypothetical protein [Lederbergia panacisoli]MCR2820912.1 hypothetical protein [Lederbergia panacisoli]